MAPEERERLILAEATRYFAEYGLGGGTLELARRLGITQPLLYKYFPTKNAMIEKVFDGLFRGHWDPRWEDLLDDSTIPLRDRLKTFYKEYAKGVLTYDHVRLFLFSGLSHFTFNSRYYAIVTERIFTRIARALRAEFLPAGGKPSRGPISDDELEARPVAACGGVSRRLPPVDPHAAAEARPRSPDRVQGRRLPRWRGADDGAAGAARVPPQRTLRKR